MTDRELLELAAKAAGLDKPVPAMGCGIVYGGGKYWNPLADDGDALRLAVKLFIFVDTAAGEPESFGAELVRAGNEVFEVTEPRPPFHIDLAAAATRRAIVRAAAEIGKATP